MTIQHGKGKMTLRDNMGESKIQGPPSPLGKIWSLVLFSLWSRKLTCFEVKVGPVEKATDYSMGNRIPFIYSF
jgi:hypothetical protein